MQTLQPAHDVKTTLFGRCYDVKMENNVVPSRWKSSL